MMWCQVYVFRRSAYVRHTKGRCVSVLVKQSCLIHSLYPSVPCCTAPQIAKALLLSDARRMASLPLMISHSKGDASHSVPQAWPISYH